MKNKITKAKQNIAISSNRLFCVLISIALLFIFLTGRVAYIQMVNGSRYKMITNRQSTSSKIISAKRGNIYDANNKALAISADVDTISCNPQRISVLNGNNVDKEKTKTLKQNMAEEIANVFGVDKDAIYDKLTSSNTYETLVSKVELDKVDEFQKWLTDNKVTNGINIDKDTKRYYPFDSLASNVIGFTGSNGQGLEGVELSYDSVLSGTSGRLTTSISSLQTAIPSTDEEYVEPQDGSNIYLTIDSNIQSIAEKYLKQAADENNCKNGGNVIIMNPKNGAIYAMATYPNYNLNTPYEPNDTLKDGWDKLSTQEQTNKLYSMWRNRAVVDTYEPGSTFKTITASIALEENLVETDTPGDFYCNGYEMVNGVRINCSSSGHGSQTLRKATENSCNPAFMQLGARIGKERFYKYLDAFGFFDKTGVDLPSEASSTFWKEDDVGAVELATMSFGQRFNITPLQLVRAVSSIANGGTLVTPHIVDKIENPTTGTITTVDTTNTRQVISEETANKVKDMMKDVVEVGGGRYAKVEGYEIGGKTGTAEPNPAHPENGYVASFIAIAPVEDTQLVCLLTLYGPRGKSIYGGRIAAPAVSQILSEVLPYLEIPSNSNKTTKKDNTIQVPNLKGKTKAEASKTLEGLGLKVRSDADTNEIITSQNPVAGTKVNNGGTVRIYSDEHKDKVMCEVPDIKGVSFEQAKNMLSSRNLNISYSGSGIVIAQDPTAGTQIEEGSVVTVTLQNKTSDYEN